MSQWLNTLVSNPQTVIALLAVIVAIASYWLVKRREQFKMGIDLMLKLEDRFDSPAMHARRAAAAGALLQGQTKEHTAISQVLDYFETVAFLLRRGAIDPEAVYTFFGHWIELYDRASREYRHQNSANFVWEEFDPLCSKIERYDTWKHDRETRARWLYRWQWAHRRVYAVSRMLPGFQRPWGPMDEEARADLARELDLAASGGQTGGQMATGTVNLDPRGS